MAPREEPEEVFTDLAGRPDPDSKAADAALLDKAGTDKLGIKDEDLVIQDEDEEEEAPVATLEPAEEEPDEDEEEDEEEEVVAPVAGADFDPKDVQLVLKDAALLDANLAHAKDRKDRAEADLVSAKSELKRAKEAGDTDADIAATEKFAKATAAQAAADNDLRAYETQRQDLAARANAIIAKAPKGADGKPILDGTHVAPVAEKQPKAEKASKLLPKFKAANAWFSNAKYKKQADALLALDRGMAAEGRFNKHTPEYFAELGRRFNREHPGLFKGLDGKPVATGERKSRVGAPIPGGGNNIGAPAPTEDSNKVKFTTGDVDLMKKFGMDPDDMGQRRQWLAEKRSMAGRAA